MNPGDTVECISNDGGLHDVLTVGKTYIVQKRYAGSIYVIADNGSQYGFSTVRFKLVKEST